jgi:hypothetical protein
MKKRGPSLKDMRQTLLAAALSKVAAMTENFVAQCSKKRELFS